MNYQAISNANRLKALLYRLNFVEEALRGGFLHERGVLLPPRGMSDDTTNAYTDILRQIDEVKGLLCDDIDKAYKSFREGENEQ